MEDKTPIYMLVIVAIVAVVGIIVMMTSSAPVPATNNLVTGNAVLDQAPSITIFGKLFFIVFLFGVAGYMYFSKQE